MLWPRPGWRLQIRSSTLADLQWERGREMTAAMLARTPDLDFLYYSNDMIGMGGLLYCQDAGIDVPGQIGMAGFNDLELLDGLPTRLATMDSMRIEIGARGSENNCQRIKNRLAKTASESR